MRAVRKALTAGVLEPRLYRKAAAIAIYD